MRAAWTACWQSRSCIRSSMPATTAPWAIPIGGHRCREHDPACRRCTDSVGRGVAALATPWRIRPNVMYRFKIPLVGLLTMSGAAVEEDGGPFLRFLRWCGMALLVAGPLIVLATLLHPSRETAGTIIASEVRLIAAHALFTLYCLLVLLGLPGLYAAQRGGMGRLGLAGFLTAFTGTYLIPVTGYFGFLAPVL